LITGAAIPCIAYGATRTYDNDRDSLIRPKLFLSPFVEGIPSFALVRLHFSSILDSMPRSEPSYLVVEQNIYFWVVHALLDKALESVDEAMDLLTKQEA
jgi:hypothetical protein